MTDVRFTTCRPTAWRVAALALVVLIGGATPPSYAQSDGGARYTMMFRGAPLSKALVEVVETTHINLVYDAELVTGRHVYCSARDAPAREVLECVLADLPLDFYQTSVGTYVLTSSPRRAPLRGHLTGTVVDRTTGKPLPRANVLLAAANTGVATNPAGRFQLPDLNAGMYRVVATHVGYETTVDSVHVAPGDSVRHQIALTPRSLTTKPVVVTQSRRRLPENGLGVSTVSSARLRETGATGTADALDQAGTLLGVHTQRPLADLHVQGGATGEHQVRLDGVPIRNPVTLRRMLGAFSPFALDRLTVRKAGYGVEHGSTISGVLDADHATNASSPSLGQLRIDPLSVNAEGHGSVSVGPNRSAQFRLAARTSLWDAYQDPTLSGLLRDWNAVDPLLLSTYFGSDSGLSFTPEAQTSSLGFSDLHGAARIDLGPYQSLQVSGYRGHNQLETEFVATAEEESGASSGAAMLTQDRYRWTNWAGQARLDWMLGPRASTSLQLKASQHSVHRGYQMSYAWTDSPGSGSGVVDTLRDALVPSRWPDDHNRVREFTLRGTGSYSFSARHHLKTALHLSSLSSDFRLGNRFFRPATYEGTRWQIGGYVRDVLSLGSGTTLNAGSRLTYIPARNTLYAEPRLILRHEGTTPPLGDYAVRVAGGIYRQFVNRFDVTSTSPTSILPSLRFWMPTGAAHAPPRAYHTTFSARVQPHDRWSMTAEGYYKHYAHLLQLDYTAFHGDRDVAVPSTQAVAAGHGYAGGLGLAVSRTGSLLESSVRYNWTHSRRTFPSRFDDRLVPTPWTHPHRVTLTSTLSTELGLEGRVRGTYAAGRSWGFRQVYYDYLGTQPGDELPGSPSFQQPTTDSPGPIFRLDVGGGYTMQWGPATMEVELTLVNALNRQNPFDWGLRPSDGGMARTSRHLPGRRLVGAITVRY